MKLLLKMCTCVAWSLGRWNYEEFQDGDSRAVSHEWGHPELASMEQLLLLSVFRPPPLICPPPACSFLCSGLPGPSFCCVGAQWVMSGSSTSAFSPLVVPLPGPVSKSGEDPSQGPWGMAWIFPTQMSLLSLSLCISS